MALARRTMVWLWLTAVGCGFVLLMGCVVAWVYLPKWAPEWVLDHSPFIDPVMRAMMVLDPPPSGAPESAIAPPFVLDRLVSQEQEERGERLQQLSAQAIPHLEACLAGTDQAMRLQALEMLSWHDLPRPAAITTLLHDPNPWIRLRAWSICTYRHPGVDQDELTATLAMLSDPDAEIRAQSREHLAGAVQYPDNLHPDARFMWDDRARWYERLRPHVHPSELADMFVEIFLGYVPGEAQLPSDLTFPLLWLAQLPDPRGKPARVVAEYLPSVEQNLTQLYAQLTEMQRGQRPWEPGAQPWMYEQLHHLFTQRITVTLQNVEMDELAKRCFPQGNVLIDPYFVAAAAPPMTFTFENQRMIDVLMELTRRLEGHLQLNNGVAFLVYTQHSDAMPVRGLVLGREIRITPGVDPRHPMIAGWQQALQHRCTVADNSVQIPQWFLERGREAQIPIDVRAITALDWEMEIHLHDLPLEQILRFMADYGNLRIELGMTGLRILPGDSR
jgi:hypothetical protein